MLWPAMFLAWKVVIYPEFAENRTKTSPLVPFLCLQWDCPPFCFQQIHILEDVNCVWMHRRANKQMDMMINSCTRLHSRQRG